ncbi:hypothetical protein D3C85_1489760 [compost metagenome]
MHQHWRALQAGEPLPGAGQTVLQPLLKLPLALAEQRPQLGSMRHSKLSRGRRRCCAQICHEIGYCIVCLMAYGRDDRNCRFINSPGYTLLVEGPQLLK